VSRGDEQREDRKEPIVTQKKASPALQLVRLVYTEGQKATGHSWTRLNQALYQAAKVAIEGGLLFNQDDFTTFHTDTRASYWIGAHPDGLYAAACKAGNESACRAYEHHYGFAPYELDGRRVFVGHDFAWNGERVTCTSISEKRLVACLYELEGVAARYERKILHRYSITPEQMNAERKKREAITADDKMQTAQKAAENYARGHNISDIALRCSIRDVICLLRDDEQKQLNDIITRRFKKSDNPTLLDLLTIAHRWKSEFRAISIIADNLEAQMLLGGQDAST